MGESLRKAMFEKTCAMWESGNTDKRINAMVNVVMTIDCIGGWGSVLSALEGAIPLYGHLSIAQKIEAQQLLDEMAQTLDAALFP